MPRRPSVRFSSSESLQDAQTAATNAVSHHFREHLATTDLIMHQRSFSNALSIHQQRFRERGCSPPLPLKTDGASRRFRTSAVTHRFGGGEKYAEALSDAFPICFLLEVGLVIRALVSHVGQLASPEVLPTPLGRRRFDGALAAPLEIFDAGVALRRPVDAGDEIWFGSAE
jgi:hypothetical protein